MFLGEYRQVVDNKGRLTFPRHFENVLAAGLVVTRGFDRNLMVFTCQGWKTLAEKILQRPLSVRQSRALRRRLFSDAAELSPDRSGSILLPVSLCDFAGLHGEVVLTGMYDYLEIWGANQWQPVRDAMQLNEDETWWGAIGI